jgi:hypothetical protein
VVRTEVAALTRERDQILVRAGVTADAGEAVLEHAAGEELVGDLLQARVFGSALRSRAGDRPRQTLTCERATLLVEAG